MIRQWIRSHSIHVLIYFGLVLMVILPFQQTSDFRFVAFDDSVYILNNKNIQAGFNWNSVYWAFTNLFACNWHPLTWLSLMLDYKLYGTNAGGYHVTNVLFHLVNTLLLFFIFGRMTGKLWQSGFVAALFAVHPLHVESVAWVFERKDVLCALFWLLTMGAYVDYTANPSWRRYIWVLAAFFLGLMSKPMLVTLPVILLFLDFWPLRRIRNDALFANRHLILEKIPLVAMSVVVSAVTVYAQDHSQALKSLGAMALSDRMVNAVVSYGGYVGKMLQPVNLACFYPYQASFPLSIVLPSGLLLIALSILSLRYINTAPYLIMGWLWYLVTLLPVIGIIQVGNQSMADRYTYIPLIGLFIIIAWGIPDLLKNNPYYRYIIPTTGGVTVLLLVFLTYNQTSVWKDSRALFEHALDVTEGNYLAHNNLGSHFWGHKRFGEAARQFAKAVQIKPNNEFYLNNFGMSLFMLQKYDEAISYYLRAIAVNPRFAGPYYNIADIYFITGRESEALNYYKKALNLGPGNALAENNVALILIHKEKLDEAVTYLKAAIKHNPDYAVARNTLAAVLTRKNQINEAIKELKEALRINPKYTDAKNNLSKLEKLAQDIKI